MTLPNILSLSLSVLIIVFKIGLIKSKKKLLFKANRSRNNTENTTRDDIDGKLGMFTDFGKVGKTVSDTNMSFFDDLLKGKL